MKYLGDVLPFMWACLWASDIKCLKELVRKARESPNDIKYMLEGIASAGDFVKKCGLYHWL